MSGICPPANLSDLEEVDRFEQAVQGYFNLELDTERFTAIRLQHGIYGQRQEGVNMVRIKVPGGLLTPPRLKVIADVVEQHSQHGLAHITTRQDIQVHYVPLEQTPEVMRKLAAAGVTTREACGNTIRNVTACPLAGVCPKERVDVTQHLDGIVQHFLRNPLNQQMPRKFKISVSGCESDCAQAMIHDLGVVAVKQDGRFGFRVYAGGGLGHKPHEAIVVEQFVEERDLLLVIEAVVALHNRYSDRVKRAKSRIKFLVDRFGPEGFVEKYREELTRTKEALGHKDYPTGEWADGLESAAPCGHGAPRKVFAQKQPGLYVFPIAVPLGDLNGKQLRGIAALMESHGLTDLRTTQDQNLMVMNVPQESIAALRAGLAALNLHEPEAGDNVVACPGTSTCRLGITSSTIVAPKLSGGKDDLRIRVSGCHNGCAQPETGDIGIYGEGRRLHGKLIPHYQMYFGGNGMMGGGIGIKGPSVPAARIEQAIARVRESYAETRESAEPFFHWARRMGQAYFAELLANLVDVKPEDVPAVVHDHGTQSEFKVLQLGGGECAGAVQVQIGSAFFEAAHERRYRDALVFQRKYGEAHKSAEAMARVIGQGLVQLLGGKKSDDLVELAVELQRVQPGPIGERLAEFVTEFRRPEEELKEPELSKFFQVLDAWTVQVAKFCQEHDRQLDLTEALPPSARPQVIQFHKPIPAREEARATAA